MGRVFVVGGMSDVSLYVSLFFFYISILDAAHCHPPTGAQGLNRSVQDSVRCYITHFSMHKVNIEHSLTLHGN